MTGLALLLSGCSSPGAEASGDGTGLQTDGASGPSGDANDDNDDNQTGSATGDSADGDRGEDDTTGDEGPGESSDDGTRGDDCDLPVATVYGPTVINRIRRAPDGGYIAVGANAELDRSNMGQPFVMKLDPLGEVVWRRALEKTGSTQRFGPVALTSDGGVFIAGWVDAQVVIRLDPSGNVLWSRQVPELQILGLEVASDDGTVFAGSTMIGPGPSNAVIGRTDGDGALAWARVLGNEESTTIGSGIAAGSDGSFHLVGSTNAVGVSSDAWVTNFQADGTLQWDRSYSAYGRQQFFSAIRDGDGLIIAGQATNNAGANQGLWLLRLSAEGQVQWQLRFSGTTHFAGSPWGDLAEIDADFVAVTCDLSPQYCDGWAIRFNTAGEVIWQRKYGDTAQTEFFTTVAPGRNGRLMLGGQAARPILGGWESRLAWVLETEPDGTIETTCTGDCSETMGVEATKPADQIDVTMQSSPHVILSPVLQTSPVDIALFDEEVLVEPFCVRE